MRSSIKIDVFFQDKLFLNFLEKLKILQTCTSFSQILKNLIHIQAGQGSCLDGT